MSSFINAFVFFFPCYCLLAASSPALANSSRPFNSPSGIVRPRAIAKTERLLTFLRPSETKLDSLTPRSVNCVFVGMAAYLYLQRSLNEHKSLLDELQIFAPSAISVIVKLCSLKKFEDLTDMTVATFTLAARKEVNNCKLLSRA